MVPPGLHLSMPPGQRGPVTRMNVGLVAGLLLGAALRLWLLDQNGWGNEYYTAGALAGLGTARR